MFALVSVAGRVRVPDAVAFAQAMHYPLGWAHPGPGAKRGWRRLRVSGSCGRFSRSLLGWEMARARPEDISSRCGTCLPTSSPLLLSPFSVAGGCSVALGHHLAVPLGVPSHPQLSAASPDPAGPALGKEIEGHVGPGRGSAPPGDAAPSPSR